MTGNGNPTRKDGGVDSKPANNLIITITTQPWHVDIAGRCDSDSLALAALRQAVDAYEAKIRQAYALQFAAQLQQARADEELRQRIAGGR